MTLIFIQDGHQGLWLVENWKSLTIIFFRTTGLNKVKLNLKNPRSSIPFRILSVDSIHFQKWPMHINTVLTYLVSDYKFSWTNLYLKIQTSVLDWNKVSFKKSRPVFILLLFISKLAVIIYAQLKACHYHSYSTQSLPPSFILKTQILPLSFILCKTDEQ